MQRSDSPDPATRDHAPTAAVEVNGEEASYLLGRARSTRAKWADVGDDHASHKRIKERDHAISQVAKLDALIAKLEAAYEETAP